MRGTLAAITEQQALVEVHGLFYDVSLPTALAERLKQSGLIGEEVIFETIYFIEAGDKKSNHYPKLVGFTDPVDREFFSLLTSVSGMGIKKALRSLVLPIKEIAHAIETKNTATLNRLPGVGGRLAEKIVAELHGKTAKFALSKKEDSLGSYEAVETPLIDEAIAVLIQLQYSRMEADRMIKSVLAANPDMKTVAELITVIFKNEQKSKVEVS